MKIRVLLAAVVIISLCLTSCSSKSEIKPQSSNVPEESVAYGIVERTARVIYQRHNGSNSVTFAYLTDGTIVSNMDEYGGYIGKKFSMVEKKDTVYYNKDGNATHVRYYNKK